MNEDPEQSATLFSVPKYVKVSASITATNCTASAHRELELN